MADRNNYQDTNSLELFLAEIEKALEHKMYLSALHMSLSIPDMLGKLAYSKSTKKKYVKWFDDNVRNIVFGYLYSDEPFSNDAESPKLNGEVCYALRCKLFHEGINDIENKTVARINEFVLVFNDEDYVRGNYSGIEYEFDKYDHETGNVPVIKYLYVSCKGLCKAIVSAARVFYKNNPNLDYPKLRINHGHGKVDSFLFI